LYSGCRKADDADHGQFCYYLESQTLGVSTSGATIMQNFTLYPYQTQSVEQSIASLESGLRTLLCLPTGSGKTVVAAEVVKYFITHGMKVLALAHRRELVEQFERLELPIDIQTIQGFKANGTQYDLIVTDEAHHATAATYRKIYAAYPKALKLGLSATPEREDGTGLGAEYDRMIQVADAAELIRDGYLPDIVGWVPEDHKRIHVDGVKEGKNDFSLTELSKICSKSEFVAGAVAEYLKNGEGRRGVVFCVDRDHSKLVNAAYLANGVRSIVLDGKTEKNHRKNALVEWRRGNVDVIVNCELFVEGVDLPDVDFVQCLRPTNSRRVYFQMIGRGMRRGARSLYLFDHTDNWKNIGLPNSPIKWQLTTKTGAGSAVADGSRKRLERGDDGRVVETDEVIGAYRSPRLVKMEVREKIKLALISDPEQSDSLIARTYEVDRKIVLMIRKSLNIPNFSRRGKPVSTDVLEKIKSSLSEDPDQSCIELAKTYSVSSGLVYKIRKSLMTSNLGSKTRGKATSKDTLGKVELSLTENPNRSNSEIAREYEVDPGTVGRVRKFLSISNQNAYACRKSYSKDVLEKVKSDLIQDPNQSNTSIARAYEIGPNVVKRIRDSLNLSNPYSVESLSRNNLKDKLEQIKLSLINNSEQSNALMARIYSVDSNTVRRIRRSLGLSRLPYGLNGKHCSKDVAEKAKLSLINFPGRSNASVAKEYGLDPGTVARIRKSLNLPNTRSPKSTPKQPN
jgi:superfamily II DNA or RNA helicase